MSEWTEAYMNVLSRARLFAAAWDEYRGNEEFGRVVNYERMRLYCVLAQYHGQRRQNWLLQLVKDAEETLSTSKLQKPMDNLE